MSYYYNYYLGEERNGKIYPLGLYKKTGIITPGVSRSRSYASDLHRQFLSVPKNRISDELKRAFGTSLEDLQYLPVSDLPQGDGLVRGFFPIKDVMLYERHHDAYLLRDAPRISPTVYSAMLQIERSGIDKQPDEKDGGWESEPKSAKDYMYYAFLDKQSKEYEANLLLEMLEAVWAYSSDDARQVILLLQG